MKSDFYDEKFVASVVLFDGLSNGNSRIRGTLKRVKGEETKEIFGDNTKIKIAVMGKRRCYGCGSMDHTRTSFPRESQERGENNSTQNVKEVAGGSVEQNVGFEEVDDLAVFSEGGEEKYKYKKRRKHKYCV